jgi:hypothetical protein
MSKCDTCANLTETYWEWNNAVYNDWICKAREDVNNREDDYFPARVKKCKHYKKATEKVKL